MVKELCIVTLLTIPGGKSYMNLMKTLFAEFVLLKGVNAYFCLNARVLGLLG